MARNPLDPFALGIGRLCHAWADLEKASAALFAIIAGMNDPAGWEMVDCLEQRDIIKALRVGAVATANSEEDYEWADALIEAIDYIDNILRPLRNRYVHDPWWHDHRGVMRATTAPRLIRAQAFQKRQVEFIKLHPGNKTELRTLIAEIKRFDKWLWAMYGWRDQDPAPHFPKIPIAGLLLTRPRPRLPLSLATQSPSGRVAPKRTRPPKSKAQS